MMTTESLSTADLARRGNPRVRWLLTPLLSHANLSTDATLGDLTRIVTFWRDVRAGLN